MSSPVGKKISLPEDIAVSDELFNAGKSSQVGEHLRSWLQKAQEYGDKSGELSLWNELMGHYRMSGERSKGIDAVRKGIALIEELHLEQSVSAGTIFLNAATVLHAFGEFDEAFLLYGKCRQVYEKHLAPDDGRFAGLYNNMAAVLADKGAYKEAEKCYLEALTLLKEKNNVLDSAVTCLNLAQLYKRWNEDEEMISVMVACSWDYFNTPECRRDGYYAHTCTKCVSGFEALGFEEMASELASRAKEIYERS